MSKERLHYLSHLLQYFERHEEEPELGKTIMNQQLILLGLHELAGELEDEFIRSTIRGITAKAVQELSRIYVQQPPRSATLAKTPLNDFLALLADPKYLDHYKQSKAELIETSGLSEEYRSLLKEGNRGRIRIKAIQELEEAGLAPKLSDKFNLEDPAPTINIDTNNFNTTNITIETTVTTTITTTDTHHSVFTDIGRDWFERAMESVDAAILHFTAGHYDKQGKLVVVGSGIKAISDFTFGALAEIRTADKVLYCVADPVTERYIHQLNPTAESMYGLYDNDKPRMDTYTEMVEEMLKYVRKGNRVCVVFYGHPGVFAMSTHAAIRMARKEGYFAEMQPGISAEASLFADLGLDPSNFGFQSYDSTEWLINDRHTDPYSHVLLWQVECAGDSGFNFAGYQKYNFPLVLEKLRHVYPENHPIIVYDASQDAQFAPRILKRSLNELDAKDLSGICTFYIPPAKTAPPSLEQLKRMGLLKEEQTASAE
ncbi:SAM-dependent methyltransferase [Paenibacillus sp. GCM10023250]|uniref:SAM-dependent methyltransferase n=1 Tax=Paenibacillus sp. GCM10023250 TaxID=3252648 RepID=UPI0036205A4D